MKYLTAAAAGKRLNRSEKTVRRWVEEGKLSAHRPAKNRLAIPESEIERLALELAQYEDQTPAAGPAIDVSSLNERIEQLEQDRRTLEQRISELEAQAHTFTSDDLYASGRIERIAVRLDRIEDKVYRSIDTPEPQRAAEPIAASSRTREHTRATTDANKPVEGAMLIKDFAERHGVNQNTFRDHVRKGIGPEKDKAPAFSRPKQKRPGETEYWILPEQQQGVLSFWQRYGVRFTVPAGDDLSQLEQDQEEVRP